MLLLEAMPEPGTSSTKSSVGISAVDEEDFKLWVLLVFVITVVSWLPVLDAFVSEFGLYVAIVEIVDEMSVELPINHIHFFFQYNKHKCN